MGISRLSAYTNDPGKLAAPESDYFEPTAVEPGAIDAEASSFGVGLDGGAEPLRNDREESVTAEELKALIDNLAPGEVLIYKAPAQELQQMPEDYLSGIKARINEISSSLEALKSELMSRINL